MGASQGSERQVSVLFVLLLVLSLAGSVATHTALSVDTYKANLKTVVNTLGDVGNPLYARTYVWPFTLNQIET